MAFRAASRLRSRPAAVRGPVDAPPCIRQRPRLTPRSRSHAAGAWHGRPVRHRAPHLRRRWRASCGPSPAAAFAAASSAWCSRRASACMFRFSRWTTSATSGLAARSRPRVARVVRHSPTPGVPCRRGAGSSSAGTSTAGFSVETVLGGRARVMGYLRRGSTSERHGLSGTDWNGSGGRVSSGGMTRLPRGLPGGRRDPLFNLERAARPAGKGRSAIEYLYRGENRSKS